MAYKDVLFALLSYPDATPEGAVRYGAALGRKLGGEVTALALQVDFPTIRNRLANALVGLEKTAEQEEARSAHIAREIAGRFTAEAAAAGVRAQAIVETAPFYFEGERVCEHARTRDLCLIPIGPKVLDDRSIAEAVLFGSGRPVVVFPEAGEAPAGDAFGTVALAWDGGSRAARAVADSLPVLTRAREVRILVITDEKPTVKAGAASDLVRHLKAHGVEAVVDEVPVGGVGIGEVLRGYVRERGVEFLAMGGFGHTRVREFVLGGATSAVLAAPPCPVLLSH